MRQKLIPLSLVLHLDSWVEAKKLKKDPIISFSTWLTFGLFSLRVTFRTCLHFYFLFKRSRVHAATSFTNYLSIRITISSTEYFEPEKNKIKLLCVCGGGGCRRSFLCSFLSAAAPLFAGTATLSNMNPFCHWKPIHCKSCSSSKSPVILEAFIFPQAQVITQGLLIMSVSLKLLSLLFC